MAWPNADDIAPGVEAMLRVNMGIKDRERLLVVTDLPRPEDWQGMPTGELEDMLERAVLARLVVGIARERFPGNPCSFYPFPASGGHGAEPDAQTAERLREADVVIALTSYSLSHTNAREGATSRGVRLASMPGFEAGMLAADGPMTVDYRQVAADCRRFAELLTAANEAVVRTPAGTDLCFSLQGRKGDGDDGIYTQPGQWGNLPAGEAYIAPLEGTAEGTLVVPAAWYPGLSDDMALRFHEGLVVEVRGGGAVGDEYRRLLDLSSDDPVHLARRNLAELGVGTNPQARRPDNLLEAEKIKGTVHLAIGDNAHMGGRVESDTHQDFVEAAPDLILDGRAVIVRGEWRV